MAAICSQLLRLDRNPLNRTPDFLNAEACPAPYPAIPQNWPEDQEYPGIGI
jgi:hypothetical protein